MNNYCIYTDTYCKQDEVSREHIFPLSLGGVDSFEIPAHRLFNNQLGSKIDGKLANDFLIILDRKRNDARGHSNKPVQAIWKKSRFDETNKPVQVKLTDNGVKYYCPITKRELTEKECIKKEILTTHVIDRFIRLKFTAKTALSAGYFVYRDLFKEFVDTRSLRDLMNMDKTRMNHILSTSKLRCTDQFYYNGKDEGDVKMFMKMAEMFEGSSVMFVLSTENILISVSTLGTYLGTINVPAKTEYFPNEHEYRLGHVVYINKSSEIKRLSFHAAVRELSKKLGFLNEKNS